MLFVVVKSFWFYAISVYQTETVRFMQLYTVYTF